jgi:hypothetical protein
MVRVPRFGAGLRDFGASILHRKPSFPYQLALFSLARLLQSTAVEHSMG